MVITADFSSNNYAPEPWLIASGAGPYFKPEVTRSLTEDETPVPFSGVRISGSNSKLFFAESISGGMQLKIINKELQKGSCIEQRYKLSLKSLIDSVQHTFNLTVEEIASVCLVSRKTIYNWKDGDKPNKPNKQKLKRLLDASILAKEWSRVLPDISREALELPVVNDKSVISMLLENELNKDLILFAGSRLSMDVELPSLEDPFA